MYKVFIDGSAGTTGLKIFDRLKVRKDVLLITLPDEVRKDVNARKEAINFYGFSRKQNYRKHYCI